MPATIVKSGSPEAGATLYCKRIFSHPFSGFEIVLPVVHYNVKR